MSCLFIAPGFFGYVKKISVLLSQRFGNVHWFEDRPSVTTLAKALCRFAPETLEAASVRYFRGIAESLVGEDISCVFVIKGEMLSVESIKMLRRYFPAAEFVIYFWDSYKNMPPSSAEKVGFFDKSFSFDMIDVEADKRLVYRPLFYTDDYVGSSCDASFDFELLFVGTDHTDRFEVLRKISKRLPESVRINVLLYSPSRILHFAKKIIRAGRVGEKNFNFVVNPVSPSDVFSLVSRSRAVIDIERSIQTGMTMRTIEVLASQRKLVTTNSYVVNSDLYSENNVLVIDRFDPVVPEEFVFGGFDNLSQDLMGYYSLNGWFDSIFAN